MIFAFYLLLQKICVIITCIVGFNSKNHSSTQLHLFQTVPTLYIPELIFGYRQWYIKGCTLYAVFIHTCEKFMIYRY